MAGLLLHFRDLQGLCNYTWNLKPPREVRWQVWDPRQRQPARTLFERLHISLQKEKCWEQIPQKRQRHNTLPRHNTTDTAPHFENHRSADSSHGSWLLSKDSLKPTGLFLPQGFINTSLGSIESEHLSRFCNISISCPSNNTQITWNVTRDMQQNTVDVITRQFQLDWKDFCSWLLEQQHLKCCSNPTQHLVLLFLSLW